MPGVYSGTRMHGPGRRHIGLETLQVQGGRDTRLPVWKRDGTIPELRCRRKTLTTALALIRVHSIRRFNKLLR